MLFVKFNVELQMMYTINHYVLLWMRNYPTPTHQHFEIAI